MSKKLVKVIETTEKQVLFECTVEDIAKAYDYAEEMENLGIDVELIAPSLPETLIINLGGDSNEVESLRNDINDEIESHISEEELCRMTCPPKKH